VQGTCVFGTGCRGARPLVWLIFNDRVQPSLIAGVVSIVCVYSVHLRGNARSLAHRLFLLVLVAALADNLAALESQTHSPPPRKIRHFNPGRPIYIYRGVQVRYADPCVRYATHTECSTPAINEGCARSLRISHSMYCIVPRTCGFSTGSPALLIARLISPVCYCNFTGGAVGVHANAVARAAHRLFSYLN
jgi:hypothetical protein